MTQLQINQQNSRKSKTVALGLINSLNPLSWAIVLLQEPYTYPNSHLTIASHHWHIIYPTDPSNQTPSSLILVNTNLDASAVMQIPIPSSLITAVAIKMAPDAPSLNIFNISNPPNLNMALIQLQQLLAGTHQLSHTIWAGIFNRHHLLWAGPSFP